MGGLRRCSVEGCKATNTQLFKAPKNPSTREKWAVFFQSIGQELKKFSLVCVKHFLAEDVKVRDQRRTSLVTGAYPRQNVLKEEGEGNIFIRVAFCENSLNP